MFKENISQEFRLEKIAEIRNYLFKEINQNELMNKWHKKGCRVLSYIDHLLIVISAITGCVSISTFAYLVGIPIGTASYAIGLTTCAITAGIKKCKSIIKKKIKKHDKIVLLAKYKLNSTEVLISKALTDPNISHDEFVLINNGLKKSFDMKEKIKNSNNK